MNSQTGIISWVVRRSNRLALHGMLVTLSFDGVGIHGLGFVPGNGNSGRQEMGILVYPFTAGRQAGRPAG